MTLGELLNQITEWFYRADQWTVRAGDDALDWLGSGWNNLITGNFLDLTIGQIAFTLLISFILWATLMEVWRILLEIWQFLMKVWRKRK